MTGEGYASPKAIESAIRSAAKTAHATDPSSSVEERIRRHYFDRFLTRVFADPGNGWILKGGTGILARIPDARSTKDIDLLRRGVALVDAVEELKELASTDLGDFFSFRFKGTRTALAGDLQEYAEGCRVDFEIFIGPSRKGIFHVDLVVGAVITDDPDLMRPAGALTLPRLPSDTAYRLYPVRDQIADKVCAAIALYRGLPSSRVKDLVDLVLIACTQEVDGSKLHEALTRESQARRLPLPGRFDVPEDWHERYSVLAAQTPACRDHGSLELGRDLVRRLVDPAVAGSVAGSRWDPSILAWSDRTG